MGTKFTNSHQPLRPVSCNRLIDTAIHGITITKLCKPFNNPNSGNRRDVTPEKPSHVLKSSSPEMPRYSSMRIRTEENKIKKRTKYQNSFRLALPLQSQYFLRTKKYHFISELPVSRFITVINERELFDHSKINLKQNFLEANLVINSKPNILSNKI